MVETELSLEIFPKDAEVADCEYEVSQTGHVFTLFMVVGVDKFHPGQFVYSLPNVVMVTAVGDWLTQIHSILRAGGVQRVKQLIEDSKNLSRADSSIDVEPYLLTIDNSRFCKQMTSIAVLKNA